MGYQSEAALERDVMNQLEAIGYERVSIRNTEALEQNFRDILNKSHKKQK